MVGFNTIFNNNPFVGQNVKPKSTNNAKPFIAPDADIIDAEIINKEFVNDKKPFIHTFTTQNNPENRNSEGFFTQADNRDFSRSAHFSQAATANIAQSDVSDRSFATGSTRYGSSGSSSFSPSNTAAAKVGRQLAFSA
jgi:hypothetical protein